MEKHPIWKRAGAPDEVHLGERTRLELVRVGTLTLAKVTLEPGWHWAEDLRPRVGTASCEVAHVTYVISGRLRVRLDDGRELLLGPGDTAYLPPGHDAWVEWDEPFVALDLLGGEAALRGLQEERRAA